MFSSLQAARVCRGRLWSRCWVWMSWRLLNPSWMQPTEHMDCEISPACCLPVCVCCVWWGCSGFGGATLGLVGLIEWDCAEHSKVTYCCVSDSVVWLLLCFQPRNMWLLLCFRPLIHRNRAFLCFILSGWVLLDLVAFCQIGLWIVSGEVGSWFVQDYLNWFFIKFNWAWWELNLYDDDSCLVFRLCES